MGRALSEHTKQILEQYAKEINFIITSTHHATSDPRIRDKVANKLAGAIRMSRMRGGDVESPIDSGLYKYAAILKEAKNKEELIEKSKVIRNISKFPEALTAFGLEWKTKFPLPEDWKQELEPERTVTGMHEYNNKHKDIVEEVAKAEAEECDTMEEISDKDLEVASMMLTYKTSIQKLSAELKELREFIKHHIHIEGGSAVVLTELK